MNLWYKEPFFQVSLPIIVMFLFTWWQHKKRIEDLRSEMKAGFDGLGKRLDDFRAEVGRRFDAVEKRLDRLEDRAGILKP